MSKRKTTFITSLGSCLEYYDFVIYLMLAPYISRVFFPAANHTVAILQTLSVFAIGYIVRPLGGMIFGSMGDRFGRKYTFTLSIMIMAAATMTIGLLPSYQHIGIASPLLLVVCRILQGISQGAELPGALTFLCEHVHAKWRGFHCSLICVGLGLGSTLASLTSFLLTKFLPYHAMVSYGWRIPFLLGGLLGVVGYFIRRSTKETPHFLSLTRQRNNKPLRYVLRKHPFDILRGFAITFFSACFILFYIFLPTYLKQYYHFNQETIYLALTVGFLASTCLLPLTGYFSDIVGRRQQMFVTVVAMIFLNYWLFKLLDFGNVPLLYVFMITYQAIVASLTACYAPMLPEMFPTSVRYTGVAISYNLAFSLAGLIPLVSTALITYTHNPLIICLLFSALAFITLVGLSKQPDATGLALT